MAGLYTSFSTSQYYDDVSDTKKTDIKNVQNDTNSNVYKKPHQETQAYGLTSQKRKSLYEEAVKVATASEKYTGPDFRQIYRVGQAVAILGPNGNYRTKKGSIAEIVSNNLMYVWMEDTYKDVNNQWQVDFVTDKDHIIKL